MKRLLQTLVFDEFNSKAPKLGNFLDGKDKQKQLTDENIKEIEDKLGVKSFEEFLEKFSPTIYPRITENKMEYTLEKQAGVKGIKLDLDFAPLRLLINLMDKRHESKQSILEFDWTDALQEIMPQSMVDDAKHYRGQLEYLTGELLKLNKEDPKFKEKAISIGNVRKKIVKIYKDNPMALLPLAIEDNKRKLEQIGFLNKKNNKHDKLENNEEPPKLGYVKFNEKGEIEFKEITSSIIDAKENSNENSQKQIADKTEKWLEKDYKSNVEEENSYAKDLILTNFSSKDRQLAMVQDIEEVKMLYKNQVEVYEKDLRGCYESLNEIFTKILGIKAYFDQKSSEDDTFLIILNEKATEISKRKASLRVYLNSLKKTRFISDLSIGSNIYTAIIPGVKTGETTFDEETYDLDDAIIIEDDDNIGERETTISGTRTLIKALADVKIMSFVSFKANKENTFEELQKKGVEIFKNHLEKMNFDNSEYIVPCFPNFCIVNEENFKINLSKIDENGKLVDKTVFLSGIYVDAAYVAAGLVAGYLHPKSLEKKFKYNKDDLALNEPGVRINLEDRELGEKIVTTMAKESSIGIVPDIQKEIKELGKGFIFSCNEQMANMYVFLCRSTNKQPIYRRLTKDYISKIFMTETNGDSTKLKDLKSGIIQNWKRQASMVNHVLEDKGVDIIFDDEGKPKIKFPDETEEMIEFEINEVK